MKTRPTQPCCCQPVKRPGPTRHLALTLLATLGWLLIPKCPMCLSAYVFAFTGATLSFRVSSLTHQLLFAFMTGMIIYSSIRLAYHIYRNRTKESPL
jgi:hypothetical protein